MHIFKICFLSILLLYTLSLSGTDKPAPPPLSQEQTRIQNELTEQFYKNLKIRLSRDSVTNLLGFKNVISDSCLDRDCNITKAEFNNHLNAYKFYSIDNSDSIRTNILFRILTDKYIRMQSQSLQHNIDLPEDSCKGNSTVYNSYKLLLFTSTDSVSLVETLQNITRKKLLFTKPVELIFYDFKGENGKIIDLFFRLEKKYLDFNIQKSTLDSAIVNRWTEPKRSNFGFYSFNVIDKKNCHPEYNDLVSIIEYERSISQINVDTINNISKFVLNDSDTLLVKLWSKTAELSDSGKMIGIDTNALSSIILPDCQLPENIRNFIREKYIKEGTLFFDNIRNNYSIWSLRIEKYVQGHVKCPKEISQNYLLAKEVQLFFQTKMDKQKYKKEVECQRQFLENLYEQNRTQFLSDPDQSKAQRQTIAITDLQIQKSVFKWIQERVKFNTNIFFIKYLPKGVTD